MRFEQIKAPDHAMYNTALALYRISFPPHEQREALSQADILGDEAYHFTLLYDGAVFVGLVLYWETESLIYIEHFCILPQMRNQKYGQQALDLLKQTGKTLVLEIDPPVNDIAIHRKGFYERNGFVENPYPHVHPPYHRQNAGHPLVIMSCPAAIGQAEYLGFKDFLDHHIMAGVFDGERK